MFDIFLKIQPLYARFYFHFAQVSMIRPLFDQAGNMLNWRYYLAMKGLLMPGT